MEKNCEHPLKYKIDIKDKYYYCPDCSIHIVDLITKYGGDGGENKDLLNSIAKDVANLYTFGITESSEQQNITIAERNKIFAEFMGLPTQRKEISFSHPRTERMIDIYFKYHSSWDVFMDVWKIFYDNIHRSELWEETTDEERTQLEYVIYSLETSNLSNANKYLYNLVIWYNKQKIS